MTKILWNPYEEETRSYKILQDPRRFYGILDKNAMESISIANKILQDPARSYKILQDPSRLYGIVDKNPMESISIANKILQDSTRY